MTSPIPVVVTMPWPQIWVRRGHPSTHTPAGQALLFLYSLPTTLPASSPPQVSYPISHFPPHSSLPIFPACPTAPWISLPDRVLLLIHSLLSCPGKNEEQQEAQGPNHPELSISHCWGWSAHTCCIHNPRKGRVGCSTRQAAPGRMLSALSTVVQEKGGGGDQAPRFWFPFPKPQI